MENSGSKSGFQADLDRMWETRPPRIPKDQGGKALIGGVCEGIGARYKVDPVLVRLIFVALSLAGGGGIFLYLLCWLNMPRFGMVVSPGKAISAPSSKLTEMEKRERSTGWALIIGLVIFLPSATTSSGLSSLLVMAAVAFTAWYLAYKRAPEPPAGLLPPNQAQQSTDTTRALPDPHPYQLDPSARRPYDVQPAQLPHPYSQPPRQPAAPQGDEPTPLFDFTHLTPPQGYPHPAVGRVTPPAWDPLGTAPELWHLPDPTAADVSLAPQTPAPAAHDRGSKRRWLWLPVGLAGLGIAGVVIAAGPNFSHYSFGTGPNWATGNLTLTYADVAAIPDLHRLAGDITLDLREVEPIDSPATIEIGNYFGNIDILLPENVPVEARCEVGAGSARCPSGTVNEDADGQLLTIDARQYMGTVTARTE